MPGLPLVLFANVWMALTVLWSQMGVWPLMALTFLLLQLAVLRWGEAPSTWSWPCPPKHSWRAFALGVGLSLPTLLYFGFTAEQDFPLSGDHLHHVLMEHELYARYFPWALYFLVLSLLLPWVKRPSLKLGALLLMWIVLVVTFWSDEPQEAVLRFPAGLYSLALPFYAALTHGPDSALPVLRVVNLLAIPFYLFVLRPRLLGKAPDLAVALLVAPWLWQKDWIYYFTTDYLEPWGLVFVWLAIESFIDGLMPWKSFLFALLACAFKELALFVLLPITLMLGYTVLRSARPVRQLLALASVLSPLVMYLGLRRLYVWRNVSFLDGTHTDWGHVLQTLSAHWYVHLRIGGIVAVVLLAGASALAWWKLRQLRPRLTLLIGALLMAELVFVFDGVSREYLGLPRFHLLTWPILSLGLVALARDARWKKWALASVVTLVILQASALPEFFQTATLTDAARNGQEHYRAPIFSPVAELVQDLRRDEDQLLVAITTHGVALHNSRPFFYPWESIGITRMRFTETAVCECDRLRSRVLNLEVYLPPEQQQLETAWPKERSLDACLARARGSCQRIREARAPDGALLGFLAEWR